MRQCRGPKTEPWVTSVLPALGAGLESQKRSRRSKKCSFKLFGSLLSGGSQWLFVSISANEGVGGPGNTAGSKMLSMIRAKSCDSATRLSLVSISMLMT